MRLLDLSYRISNEMAVYPGDPKARLKTTKGKTTLSVIEMGSHNGTHVDAPRHVFEDGKTLDLYDVSKFIGNALKIDLKKSNKNIKKEHLEKYKEKIKNRKIIILETGYGKIIKDGKVDLNFPYLTKEAAEFLAEFDLDLIGIDSVTIDKPKSTEAHKILLQKDILLVETLVNLENLPEEFELIALPLFIKDSDGSPCRAVAIIK